MKRQTQTTEGGRQVQRDAGVDWNATAKAIPRADLLLALQGAVAKGFVAVALDYDGQFKPLGEISYLSADEPIIRDAR